MSNLMAIAFNNKNIYTIGLIEDLLLKSYQDIPTTTKSDRQSFSKFENEVNNHLNWLGKNIFITSINDFPVGFVSFDPRKKPIAEIGHNCIIPEYKGKGLGIKQMNYAIDEIKKQGFEKIIVSTGRNKYFVPAQKMYKTCGFVKTRKFYREGTDFEMIGYELDLTK